MSNMAPTVGTKDLSVHMFQRDSIQCSTGGSLPLECTHTHGYTHLGGKLFVLPREPKCCAIIAPGRLAAAV